MLPRSDLGVPLNVETVENVYQKRFQRRLSRLNLSRRLQYQKLQHDEGSCKFVEVEEVLARRDPFRSE